MKLILVPLLVLGLSIVNYAEENNEILHHDKIPVLVGGNSPENACISKGIVYGLKDNSFLAVRLGNSTKHKKSDNLHNNDTVWLCDKKGDWMGIVYGKDCGVGFPIDEKKEYNGSCKFGWSHQNWLKK